MAARPDQAPPRPARALRGDEAAVGDFVGTLLMVALAVALASVVAVVVATSLDEPAPPRASLSLASVAPGDEALHVLLRNGEPVPLDALAVTLERNGSAPQPVPRASWSTPDADAWRAGDRLTISLSPAAAPDETLRVRLVRQDANALLGALAGRASAGDEAPSALALSASLSPPTLVADGLSTGLLTVRAVHPGGALGVASMVADLSEVSRAAGAGPLLVALSDSGRDGDAVGGDGVWSALLRAPRATPPGPYVVTINATDAWGRLASTTLATSLPAGTVATLHAGVAFEAPTSANVTTLRLRNWTWDALHAARLDDDSILLRAVSGGKTWNALIRLDEANGAATLMEVRVWDDQDETLYVPRNGTRLPLAGLDLDLLDPVASEQLVYASGSPHPGALYAQAGLQERPRLFVAHFGQEATTRSAQMAFDTGIYAVEAVMR